MRVPLSWLAELVDDLPDAAALADLLPGLGLGVEEVVALPAAPPGVVVVDILEAEPIAGSDGLARTVVDDGHERHQVVCGAPNARVGVRTALALPGTQLAAAGVTVGVRELAGVASVGMLCSPRELGLWDAAAGVVVFGRDAPLGGSLHELWPAETVLELELTPNRADAFSLLGVARDLAAKLNVPFRHPAHDAVPADPDLDDGLTVEVADPSGCPHLVLQRIDGVTVAPSPLWLQRRLAALGLRPRNNVVDVTNYVTFELGQPSHAYDRRVLVGGRLQVRRARDGEGVVLLDGEEHTLAGADLVIATPAGEERSAPGGGEGGSGGGSKAVGLAGVMGGRDDSVRADTTTVALEVAHFDPVSVRRTAKRHGLHSDAHYRFERGVDPALPPRAAAHAARLIARVAGGSVHPGVSRSGGSEPRPEIRFRPSRVEFLMSFDVPLDMQRRYLEALGCEVRDEAPEEVRDGADGADGRAWRVRPPSWRFDLAIEEDLVEEVGRLHGYEHVGATRPDMPFTPAHTDPTHRTLRDELAAKGLQETIAYVFTGEEEARRAKAPTPVVRLSNPQGIERALLRTALHPGLLAAAAANAAEPGLALFEIGRVFGAVEEERLALLLSGAWERQEWRDLPAGAADFWRLKGLLEGMAVLRRARLELRPADEGEAPMLHPGVAAIVLWNGRAVGHAGQVHPEVADRYGLPPTFLTEVTLPLEAERLAIREVPRQPHAERDLAIVAPRDVPYARLAEVARAAAGDRLVETWPFDVYEGRPLDPGDRSVALRFRWRDPERALRDEEVDVWLNGVIAAVREAGWSIRG